MVLIFGSARRSLYRSGTVGALVAAVAFIAATTTTAASSASLASPVQRRVRVSGRQFVLAATGEPIVMSGPNVVVKGPPYLRVR